MVSLAKKEVVFRLLDGRKVIVTPDHEKDTYKVKVFEATAKVEKQVYFKKIRNVKYDGKIATYRQVMNNALSKTLYITEGAEDICVRLLG